MGSPSLSPPVGERASRPPSRHPLTNALNGTKRGRGNAKYDFNLNERRVEVKPHHHNYM